MSTIREREIATILAALREIQKHPYHEREWRFHEHFMDHLPLADYEIDELCERLNTESVFEVIR